MLKVLLVERQLTDVTIKEKKRMLSIKPLSFMTSLFAHAAIGIFAPMAQEKYPTLYLPLLNNMMLQHLLYESCMST